MGQKRLKLARGLDDLALARLSASRIERIVPSSVNFSDLEKDFEENNEDFEPGDDGGEVLKIEDNMAYEELLVFILSNLEIREKLVFIYQILRDGGYQIDHASFARTIGLSRRQYMRVLEDVRLKSSLYICGYKKINEVSMRHK